jgi:hypothetical protein
MKHIASIGGGFTSTVTLPLHLIEKYGAENVDFVMCMVKDDLPTVMPVVEWLERETGKRMIRVTAVIDGKKLHYNTPQNGWKYCKYWINSPLWAVPSIWDVFHTGRMMGGRFDPCSKTLKRETFRAYLLDHYAPEDTIIHVGITDDEIDRMLAIRRNWNQAGYEVRASLAEDGVRIPPKEEVAARIGFMPATYEAGLEHNNCSGFCVKGGFAHMYKLWLANPDLLQFHAEQEAIFQQVNDTDVTIMRRRIGGVTQRVNLRDVIVQFKERPYQMTLEEAMGLESGCKFCDSLA